MIRVLLTAAAVCLFVVIAVGMIGRAVSYEVQEHVVFTKHGETLECNRTVGAHGHVFYDHCVTVP
jgi:hypothetical protein